MTVYKQHRFWGRNGPEWQWERVDSVHPAHTQWSMQPLDIAMDYAQFQAVMRKTRIGRLYGMLRPETNKWHTLELTAIANCARRPWLEYVYKSGQRYLARQLMRAETIPKDTGINRRGKTPRALLNLTEGQWYEVRRDGLSLTLNVLKTLRAMEALDIGPVKASDALRISGGTDAPWRAVEFSAKTGKLVQDRGAYNDARGGIPPGTKAQLRNFWNAWDKAHRKGRKSA